MAVRNGNCPHLSGCKSSGVDAKGSSEKKRPKVRGKHPSIETIAIPILWQKDSKHNASKKLLKDICSEITSVPDTEIC